MIYQEATPMRKVTATGAAGTQRGLRALRTASSICIRSTKPPVQGQQYLDLYVLQRDKARWGQLKARAEEMIRSIDKAMNKLGLGPHCLEGPPATQGARETRPPTIVVRSQSRKLPCRGRSEKVA
jgi:hypothetical protein